ncbi:MAG: 3-hydroxyacyl-CoA dehydrogenase [Chloroflexota bacterium]|jgi:NAD(P)-dependent dehydrogenase (short-subunit alcohol dehydrogenase family)|nr:3-hydroxyacyl-CoA dehydrogenase [Chloroflexota bacterium]
MQIQNHTFIISGGSSGLGAATASMIRQNGGNVVIADINPPREEIVGAKFIKTDVTSDADGKAAVQFALAEFGAVHGLANCAGIGIADLVLRKGEPHPLDRFVRVIQINLIGTFNMIRLAGQAMSHNTPNAQGERGVIINTASVAAYDGQIGQAAYSASKGGVVGMTLPIAREYARYGIRVMTIAPGIFDTPMLAGLPQEARDSLGKQVPFPPRLGQPVEYAFLAQHIIENVMLNGEVIRLDGAIRMAAR